MTEPLQIDNPDAPRYKQQVACVCQNSECGMKFFALLIDIERGRGKCCSRKCAASIAGRKSVELHPQAGEKNHHWKGGKRQVPEWKLIQRAQQVAKTAVKRKWIKAANCGACGHSSHPIATDLTHPLEGLSWMCRNPDCATYTAF